MLRKKRRKKPIDDQPTDTTRLELLTGKQQKREFYGQTVTDKVQLDFFLAPSPFKGFSLRHLVDPGLFSREGMKRIECGMFVNC